MGLCAFLMLISHANLRTGQQQLLIQTQVISLPVARSLHALPHYSNKGMCLCLQVAAKPVSLSEGSDSAGGKVLPCNFCSSSPGFPPTPTPEIFHLSCQDSSVAHETTADLPQFTAQRMTANHYWQRCSVTVLAPS